MQDIRKHPRIPCRLAVELFAPSAAQAKACRTRDIGLGGLFAPRIQLASPGNPIRVALRPSGSDALQLEARVVRVSVNGTGCEFVNLGATNADALRTLLTPAWDGEDLLAGVMKMAPWHDQSDLASWMRLTSLVSGWHRLTNTGAKPS